MLQAPTKLDFEKSVLTEDHKAEICKHAGFDQSNIAEHYDNLSANYEAIYLKAGFGDPLKAAETVAELCPAENRKQT